MLSAVYGIPYRHNGEILCILAVKKKDKERKKQMEN
jgi:hypothetical protein